MPRKICGLRVTNGYWRPDSAKSSRLADIGLAAVLMALVSACESLDEIKNAVFPPPAATEPVAAARANAPLPMPPKPANRGARNGSGDLSTPESLIGISQEDVQNRFGVASDIRDAAPAKVWEYRSGSCLVDLFFYMDLNTKQFRVLAYDIKRSDGVAEDMPLARCLRELEDARRG